MSEVYIVSIMEKIILVEIRLASLIKESYKDFQKLLRVITCLNNESDKAHRDNHLSVGCSNIFCSLRKWVG